MLFYSETILQLYKTIVSLIVFWYFYCKILVFVGCCFPNARQFFLSLRLCTTSSRVSPMYDIDGLPLLCYSTIHGVLMPSSVPSSVLEPDCMAQKLSLVFFYGFLAKVFFLCTAGCCWRHDFLLHQVASVDFC